LGSFLGLCQAIVEAKEQGGQVVVGGNVLDRPGNFVEPTIILSRHDAPSSFLLALFVWVDG
jgi:acyl-CoA reductase-like NAD-dependent aldehyde dehydrogenase